MFHIDINGNPNDDDADGLPDYLEDSNGNGTPTSSDLSFWQLADTDDDTLLDGWEYEHGLNPRLSDAGEAIWWGSLPHPGSYIPGITNVIALAGGANHAILLQETGTVVGWGTNNFGQTNTPVGLVSVVSIAAGDNHNLALKSDGTVMARGLNTLAQTNVPSSLTNVVSIAAGGDQSLALLSNGTVTNWGTSFVSLPAGLTDIMAIAAGTNFYVALRSNSTIVAWGNNTYGQTNISVSNIVAIAAGGAQGVWPCGVMAR